MDWLEQEIFMNGYKLSLDMEYTAFGDSTYFNYFYEFLQDRGYRIKSFCDQTDASSGRAELPCGVKGISINDFLNGDRTAPVLVFADNVEDITKILQKRGFSNLIEISILFLNYCMINSRAIMGCSDKLEQVIGLMDDERSKEILRTLANIRFTMNYELIDNIFNVNKVQYFDDDIVTLSDDEILVDGGAYNSVTSLTFIAKLRSRFKKIYLFEPDERMYDISSALLNVLDDERLELFKKGLYDSCQTVNFSLGDIGSSAITENGNASIETDYLDNLIDKATFIKMDIEGAEINALMGAKRIIQTYRPKLAICIYHKMEHLWEVPLLIKSLSPEYKLYVRHYSDNYYLTETVCYAI